MLMAFFYSANEALDDWQKNGYNQELDTEEVCDVFNADYGVFRKELFEKMIDEDFVLMMTKIHYPPVMEFEVYNFIERVCDTNEMHIGEGDIEHIFGIDSISRIYV